MSASSRWPAAVSGNSRRDAGKTPAWLGGTSAAPALEKAVSSKSRLNNNSATLILW
jgi:hypothetical protein